MKNASHPFSTPGIGVLRRAILLPPPKLLASQSVRGRNAFSRQFVSPEAFTSLYVSLARSTLPCANSLLCALMFILAFAPVTPLPHALTLTLVFGTVRLRCPVYGIWGVNTFPLVSAYNGRILA